MDGDQPDAGLPTGDSINDSHSSSSISPARGSRPRGVERKKTHEAVSGMADAEGPIREGGGYSQHNPTLALEGVRRASINVNTALQRRDSRRASGIKSLGQAKSDEVTDKAVRRREEAVPEHNLAKHPLSEVNALSTSLRRQTGGRSSLRRKSSDRLTLKTANFGEPKRGGGESESGSRRQGGIFHPYGLARQLWDTLIVLILLYNAFVLPVRMALHYDAERRADGFFWFDRFTDLLFMADLVFNFFTGYVSQEGAVIMDYSVIIRRYLRGWFMVDLISSIPFELIFYFSAGESFSHRGAQVSKLLRTVRLARIAKLLRLFRLFRFVNVLSRFGGAYFLSYSTAAMVKFVVITSFAIHWAACLFVFLDFEYCGAESFVVEHQLIHPTDTYVAAMYWSLATFLTIGYGDITATCTETRVLSMFVMLMGSTLWGYGLNYTMTLVNQKLHAANVLGDRMASISRFMHYRNLQPALKTAVQGHFQMVNAGFLSRESLLNEKQVLSQMTPGLRSEVITSINRHIIKSVPILDRITRPLLPGGAQLLNKLMYILEAKIYRPDELITREGQLSDCIYILSKGRVEVIKWGKIRIALLEDGAAFGEATFLANPNCPDWQRRRWATVCSQTYCDIRYISRTRLEQILPEIPELDVATLRTWMNERHDEVVREQASLLDACLAQYPDIAREYEQEARSSDDDEWDRPVQNVSPRDMASISELPPHSEQQGYLSPHEQGRIGLPVSPRDRLVTATSVYNMSTLDRELQEDGHMYDAGIWLSPTAKLEHKRYARTAAASDTQRHLLSSSSKTKKVHKPHKQRRKDRGVEAPSMSFV